jgi:hypothetical protein
VRPARALPLLLLLLALAAGCELLFGVDSLDNQQCGPDEKPCPSLKLCVKKNDPNTGCGNMTSCTPCALPHSVAICQLTDDWVCKVVGCERNWKSCNGQNACETDLQHDPDNCGDCGNVCTAFPNAFRACSGSCTIGGCLPGFRDCDGDPTDGCETDVSAFDGGCP